MAIAIFLAPKTPPVVIVLLAIMFLLLLHPVWNFWWIEKTFSRRIVAVMALVVGLIAFAIWAWPPVLSSKPAGVLQDHSEGEQASKQTPQVAPPQNGTSDEADKPSKVEVPRVVNAHDLPYILESDFDSEVRAPIPVLVFFFREHYDACEVMLPAVMGITQDYSGKVKIVRVDVIVNSRLAEKYNADLFQIPVLILFKNGVAQGRINGAASRQAITHLIENPQDFRIRPDQAKNEPQALPAAENPLATVSTVPESDFDDEVLKSTMPVLVFFYWSGAAACATVSPSVAQIARTQKGKIKVFKIDSNINRNVAERYRARIYEVPVLILFKDGMERGRIKGTTSRQAVARLIERPEDFRAKD